MYYMLNNFDIRRKLRAFELWSYQTGNKCNTQKCNKYHYNYNVEAMKSLIEL